MCGVMTGWLLSAMPRQSPRHWSRTIKTMFGLWSAMLNPQRVGFRARRQAQLFRPDKLKAKLIGQQCLEVTQVRVSIADLTRRQAMAQAVSGQRTGGLADVPFDRMQPVTTVGDMRDAEVLAGRQQVVDPSGDERAERNLVRPVGDVEVATTIAGM